MTKIEIEFILRPICPKCKKEKGIIISFPQIESPQTYSCDCGMQVLVKSVINHRDLKTWKKLLREAKNVSYRLEKTGFDVEWF